jgi:hypothetical protein
MALNIVLLNPGNYSAQWCKEVGLLNRLDCTQNKKRGLRADLNQGVHGFAWRVYSPDLKIVAMGD